MIALTGATLSTWSIAAGATLGVISRPFKVPEAVWAVLGGLILCVSGLLSWTDARHAVGKGTDVYLFLTGMMLIAELARSEGLFDSLAALATRWAAGSPRRLFLLVYAVGTVVTVFMSNDATAVVLTPAVLAATRAAKVREPLPYLFICAFIANAASFVLPISNPANLVVYGPHMPPLIVWLERFALPSVVAIVLTYAVLRVTQRKALAQPLATDVPVPPLSSAGRLTAYGIAGMAVVLLVASALDRDLGRPACASGVLTYALVCARKRTMQWQIVRGVSWSVLPLVGGLFVLVEGLQRTGVIHAAGQWLEQASQAGAPGVWAVGAFAAVADNLINNLPAGLIAGSAVAAAHVATHMASALLIAVDLGPNLSITGSLATILWLIALRREGQAVSGWAFLKLGCLVMPPALLGALAVLALMPG